MSEQTAAPGPDGHDRDRVTVERFIPAPAQAIFDLLADPARHRDLDGSGHVLSPKAASDRLAPGRSFAMSMRMGVPYSMVSTVVEFEEGRRIAWQTHGPTAVGRFFGGRIWRYELEPAAGGTVVRETWDISKESPLTRPLVRPAAKATRRDMEATLARIEKLLAG
ncbi:MAG TPA: SRPBCC family protein [Acidimicrobiales bacterium]|nr:SRPBCC family protein [Acidimicrobiales bacterium]